MTVLLNRPDTAAGIEPVHEARQVPALVQAHADGQAAVEVGLADDCLLYTSPSPRDVEESRMPSSA